MIAFLCAGMLFTRQIMAAEIPVAYSIEEIEKFDSYITINQDTSLSIIENIDYFTPIDKHGIYRYIPEKYKKNGIIESKKVSDISVKNDKGETIPFQTSRGDGNVTIKIGDPDTTFTGLRAYTISYRISKAISRQKEFDELYWDITGEGWQFPISKARVFITSPFATTIESKCFTGPVGGEASDCVFGVGGAVTAFTTSPTNNGENFTVAVKLDKNNSLVFPTTSERISSFIYNNYPFALLFLPGLGMFFFWYKKGRDFRFDSPNVFNMDPDQLQRMRPVFEPINIPMVYEPFKNLTPGEAGALLDEKVDNQDVVSEIIDLARRKYLKIEKVEAKGFLKFGSDYLFSKLKEPSNIPNTQTYLMEKIFETGDTVKLSNLKGNFYSHMTKVKAMINEGLRDKKLYTGNPNNVRGYWFVGTILVCCLIFATTVSTIGFLGEAWPVILFVISYVSSVIFAWNMPQKTAVGTNLSLQAKGLRDTIRLGKWREEIKEKHLFIEEVLPFAISLGVIDKLAKDMAILNLEPPKYMAVGLGTNMNDWSRSMSDFSTSAASGLSYNSSSSSMGGSGFSGGSSGGGGGGGGGGSW